MKLFSADLKDLHELYVAKLKKALDLENTIVEKGLPGLIEHATDSALVSGLQAHLEESRTHIERLNTILEGHTGEASSEKCPAIHALVTEAEDGIKDAGNTVVRDITIIAAAQEVEHHEIAVYGTLLAWAELMGHDNDADLLATTLEEEKAADETLTAVSETVNVEGQAVSA